MASDPFRIRDHVAAFDDIVAEIRERSAETRRRLRMSGGVAYGTGQGETLDLFWPANPAPGAPVHIFIHGGYWRMFSKDDYSYVADTICSAGAIAVIVDYALMPGVRMATIVDQMQRAKAWVRERIGHFGGDPARLTVSGHSAGAHLASFLFETQGSGVKAALLLGGLYALKPLQTSFLMDEIGLTDEEVAQFSPMTRPHDPQTQVDILVGSEETPPFHAQADQFRDHLANQGLVVTRSNVTGRNHMDSVRDLGIATSDAGRSLDRLIRKS